MREGELPTQRDASRIAWCVEFEMRGLGVACSGTTIDCYRCGRRSILAARQEPKAQCDGKPMGVASPVAASSRRIERRCSLRQSALPLFSVKPSKCPSAFTCRKRRGLETPAARDVGARMAIQISRVSRVDAKSVDCRR